VARLYVNSARKALAVLLMLSIPHAAATTEWTSDPWLELIIGPERIAGGDEIGCHGIPGTSIDEDPEAWVLACRNYVGTRSQASRWSNEIVSFGAQTNAEIHSDLATHGVAITGDLEATDVTPEGEVWTIGFDGGGLEKNVGDLERVKLAAAGGGMVHMHWQALIDDINVRRDRDLVNWLENSDAWSATWGEVWSYSLLRNRSMNLTIEDEYIVLESPALTEQDDLRLWPVPTTVGITTGATGVVSAQFNEQNVAEWAERPSLLERGWRTEGQEVLITLQPGDVVKLTLNGPAAQGDVTSRIPEWFDDKPWVLTIAGLHVLDLRDWSADFTSSPLKFTWLVEPRTEQENGPFLPCLAATIAMAVVIVGGLVLRRDRQLASRALAAWNESE